MHYAKTINSDFSAMPARYEGQLAFAYVKLASNPMEGVMALQDLITLDSTRAEAHFVLTNHYL